MSRICNARRVYHFVMATQGQRISEYVLDQRLGAGAFGEVWRARHHVWHEQLVAIKLPTDPRYVRNLQREGAALHGLSHPNVVAPKGFDPFATPPYLTMEYVPGTSLRPIIAARSATVSDTVSILRQALAGLAHAHAAGIVHRDIKPENILVHERAKTEGYSAPGVIKLTDFGLGLAAADTAQSIVHSQSLDDDAGRELAGTLDYMPPEVRGGAPIDLAFAPRADLYAVAVVLFELLTGERPAGLAVPSELNRQVPKELDDVFRRGYARVDKRFASADDFAAALAASIAPAKTVPPITQRVVARAVRKPQPAACRSCGKGVDAADQFCMHCGVQLAAVVRRCPKCSAFPDPGDRFCLFCGETLLAVTS